MNRRDFIINTTLSTTGLVMANHGIALGGDSISVQGKKIGIIGLDTGHSQIFTQMINSGGPDMKGYKVVAAYPHGSKDIASALKMKPDIIKAVQNMGVELVDSIEALLANVDVVLLESNDGRPHLEQVLPVFKAGKRVFIDKPVAPDLAGTKAIFKAAAQYQTPLFTSSALRFDTSVRKVAQGSIGRVTGADVYTPADFDKHHSDLAWYAIHGIEMLFTVMGQGCVSVTRIHQADADVVVGVWKDGRIGSVRGIRKGATAIAGTAFGEKGIAALGPFSGYETLVKEIILFFETGKPPVEPEETIEIFNFIEAADESRRRGGKRVYL